MGQTSDGLPDCQGILTLHLRREISSNQGNIHASISEPTSWYLAYNHLPNVSSFISNKTEHRLLTGWPYNLVNMFTTDSYGPPSDTINCPVALIFPLPESMSLSVFHIHHLSVKNCEGAELYFTGDLWMLAVDVRLLCQSQRTSLLMTQKPAWKSAYIMQSLWAQVLTKRAKWYLHVQ